jgi:excisionase family DNA binding protein
MNEELTTSEAAIRLGKSRRAVQWLITNGHLPAEKFGRDYRIKAKDLRLVEGIKPGPKPKRSRKKPAAAPEKE